MSRRSGPLRVAVLVSATGANLRTLLALQAVEPALLDVCLVASHAPNVAALRVAAAAGIQTWPGDFDSRCGLRSTMATADDLRGYRARGRQWHDDLNAKLAEWESHNGFIDLIVLAYHRLIEGDLLTRFAGRMINMHPGDLSILGDDGARLLIGRSPVQRAFDLGHRETRTSCFLVDDSVDGGPVLCLGPPVPRRAGRSAQAHEAEQKVVSDPPALVWSVRALAERRISLADTRNPDGSRVVELDGIACLLGGVRLDAAEPDQQPAVVAR
ncbi:MAG: formyltransferase family protein [Jatrophihabitantaceae bacterium]